MSDVQTRDNLGRFVLGMTPHNKKWFGKCCIVGCDRTDMKAFGLCHKHYKTKQSRERNGIFNSDLSKRLPRTEEHKRNNVAYTKRPDYVSGLKGRTFEEIYGSVDKAKERADKTRGENGGNWKGGKSFEKYPEVFKREMRPYIRKRDRYTCRECGVTEKDYGRNLDVHHIDFDKKNNHESNLISLCKRCHGNTQKDREAWISYYKKKMEVLS